MSGAAELGRISPGPVGIGTTFRQRDRFLGRRLELTVQVVDYEPIHKVTLQTTSRGLSFAGSRRVEPVGHGAARVCLWWRAGRWRVAAGGPLLAAVGGRRLRTSLVG